MIGERSIVAAGAVVLEGQIVPPRSLVAGVPARVFRELSDADIERIQHAASHYVAASRAFKAEPTSI